MGQAVALTIGLLIGLERGWHERKFAERGRVASLAVHGQIRGHAAHGVTAGDSVGRLAGWHCVLDGRDTNAGSFYEACADVVPS